METSAARLFFAARPEPAAVRELQASQAQLKSEPWQDRVRWTDSDAMHLTLKFLGNTPRERIPEIIDYVRDNMTVPEIILQISGITMFPNAKRPTVLAAIITDNEALSKLAAQLNRIMEHFGYKPEKRTFKPHITLGRCKKGFPRGVDLSEHLVEPITGYMDDIVLYESITRPEGAQYHEVARFKNNL